MIIYTQSKQKFRLDVDGLLAEEPLGHPVRSALAVPLRLSDHAPHLAHEEPAAPE